MSRSIRPDRTPVSLKGKRVIVTGASAGIGAATAAGFAAEGSDLVLVARREDRIKALGDRLASEHGVGVTTLAIDVSDRGAVEAAAREHRDLFAGTDVLVNNAGLARGVDRMQDADLSDWQVMMDTNVMGLLYMTRMVVSHMVERGHGHIVNLGSVAGRWVYPGGGVYCATKHAVRALSEGLRMDVLGKGVRVTNIEPGLVETEFSIVRLKDQDKADKVYADMTPLVGEDIADAIVWSCTRPAHVNIQEMVIYPTDQSHVAQVHRRGNA